MLNDAGPAAQEAITGSDILYDLQTFDGTAVAICTLNRPAARNALTIPMLEALLEALERASAEAQALVLAGAGSTFCAGADTTEIPIGAPSGRRELIEAAAARIAALPASVSVVQRAAVGAGWSLALAADFCLAEPGALFRLPELGHGVPVIDLTLARLRAALGPAQAFAAVALEEPWSAERLATRGLVEIVPSESLLTAAVDRARALAAKSPALLAQMKASLWGRGSA